MSSMIFCDLQLKEWIGTQQCYKMTPFTSRSPETATFLALGREPVGAVSSASSQSVASGRSPLEIAPRGSAVTSLRPWRSLCMNRRQGYTEAL